MQIVCPRCATSYETPEAALPAGRKVRCAKCRHVWTAETPAELVPETAVDAEDAADAAGASALAVPAANDIVAPRSENATAAPETGAPAMAVDGARLLPADAPPVGGVGVISDAPPLAPEPPSPVAPQAAPPVTLDAEQTGADDLAARRAVRRTRAAKRRGVLRPSWATLVLSLMTVIAAILAWRAETVRAMPQTAALFARIGLPVNLRGLAFQDVTIEQEMADGVSVLVAQGNIVNVANRRVDVPRLRFALRDSAGVEVYSWTAMPARASLGPGEGQEFRTRLASPPAEASNLAVRFFTRRDR